MGDWYNDWENEKEEREEQRVKAEEREKAEKLRKTKEEQAKKSQFLFEIRNLVPDSILIKAKILTLSKHGQLGWGEVWFDDSTYNDVLQAVEQAALEEEASSYENTNEENDEQL